MNTVKLREAVKKTQRITVEKKPALFALKCECCGLVFNMQSYCNDVGLAELKGTFDDSPPILGNMFFATVCSFKCAHEIMNGGWKKLPKYKAFVRLKANLVRCELKITSFLLTEKEIIEQWNQKN